MNKAIHDFGEHCTGTVPPFRVFDCLDGCLQIRRQHQAFLRRAKEVEQAIFRVIVNFDAFFQSNVLDASLCQGGDCCKRIYS